jgi:hypothetical protein
VAHTLCRLGTGLVADGVWTISLTSYLAAEYVNCCMQLLSLLFMKVLAAADFGLVIWFCLCVLETLSCILKVMSSALCLSEVD